MVRTILRHQHVTLQLRLFQQSDASALYRNWNSRIADLSTKYRTLLRLFVNRATLVVNLIALITGYDGISVRKCAQCHEVMEFSLSGR